MCCKLLILLHFCLVVVFYWLIWSLNPDNFFISSCRQLRNQIKAQSELKEIGLNQILKEICLRGLLFCSFSSD